MDAKLKDYLSSGEYLPNFIMEFHDQKTLFKRLDEINKNRKSDYTKNVDWVSAQVYTVDIFLWFMACHGYTLQKSRKKVPFYDIDHDLSEFEKQQREASSIMLKQIIEQHRKGTNA